jgi:hypothetical protein
MSEARYACRNVAKLKDVVRSACGGGGDPLTVHAIDGGLVDTHCPAGWLPGQLFVLVARETGRSIADVKASLADALKNAAAAWRQMVAANASYNVMASIPVGIRTGAEQELLRERWRLRDQASHVLHTAGEKVAIHAAEFEALDVL